MIKISVNEWRDSVVIGANLMKLYNLYNEKILSIDRKSRG